MEDFLIDDGGIGSHGGTGSGGGTGNGTGGTSSWGWDDNSTLSPEQLYYKYILGGDEDKWGEGLTRKQAIKFNETSDYIDFLNPYDNWKEGYFENVYQNRMEQTGIQQDQIQNQLKSARERFGIETTNMFKTGDIQGTQQRQQAQMGMGKQGFQGSGFNQQQLDDSLKNLQDGLNTNLKNLRLGFRDQRSALNTQYSMLTSQSSMYAGERDKNIRENKDSWEQSFFDRLSNINMWSNK